MKPISKEESIHETLELLRVLHESGTGTPLIDGIVECIRNDARPPLWLRANFLAAVSAVRAGKHRSWDDAFGKPHKKHANLEAQQRKSELQLRVWRAARRAIDSEATVDEALFESIGANFGIGKTLASEYFYDVERFVSPDARPLDVSDCVRVQLARRLLDSVADASYDD